MSTVTGFAGFRKKHGPGQSTPRGRTPLVVHCPPVHDVLRHHGVEPLSTR